MEAGGNIPSSEPELGNPKLTNLKGRTKIWGHMSGLFIPVGIQGEAPRMACKTPVGEWEDHPQRPWPAPGVGVGMDEVARAEGGST